MPVQSGVKCFLGTPVQQFPAPVLGTFRKQQWSSMRRNTRGRKRCSPTEL
jgi:hypothetical protein